MADGNRIARDAAKVELWNGLQRALDRVDDLERRIKADREIILTENELAEIRRGGCIIRDGVSICYD